MNDKICGYYLDEQQQAIVLDNSKYLLVVAGAGSGKTLTILGKINYLIKYKQLLSEEILCISFTKASSDSLKQKIKNEFNIDMPVYTFHKLSLKILQLGKINYHIADPNLLDMIVDNFFRIDILNSNYHMQLILLYFKKITVGNIRENYLKFLEENQDNIKILKRLTITFIHLFKCNNNTLQDFSKFLMSSKRKILNFNYRKEKILLTIFLNIYLLYETYLNNNQELDFDDMISKATYYVQENELNFHYKYIIIDEYQDTSMVRFLLIKEILNKTNANLMVVGDDFQSIYRFTGCDLAMFINFKEYFNNSKILKIENTYRNSQELIKVAGNFVMKNKAQINKQLKSFKTNPKPIKLVYYKEPKQTFSKILLNIFQETGKPIMVLGRNNNDIFNYINENWSFNDWKLIYKYNKSVQAYFLTTHKSKGLEEENVIIINLCDDVLGFPSKLKDDKILRYVSNNNEKFLFSEERRLFYVALTRTKNCVYLLAPLKKSSNFIKELIRDYFDYIEVINVN